MNLGIYCGRALLRPKGYFNFTLIQPDFGLILDVFQEKIGEPVSLVSGDFWSFAQIVLIL